ncbi:MAG: HEPN domain-containing protein, partial [Solirubrobacteraceae bacterium]
PPKPNRGAATTAGRHMAHRAARPPRANFGASDSHRDPFDTSLLEPATGVLFGTLSSRMYVTSQLVVLASVAEAYHRTIDGDAPVSAGVHERVTQGVLDGLDDEADRSFYERALRHVNQFSQEQRIVALTKRAATVVGPLGNKPGRLGQRITATRNALVHLPAAAGEVLDGRDLIEAVELLVLVLNANLLLDLGLSSEHAAVLLARSYGRQLLWQRLQRRDCSWPKSGSPLAR